MLLSAIRHKKPLSLPYASRMQTLENQKPAEPSYDEYTEILGFYRKINQPLISFLESIQLSSYEIFICILIFEKVSLKEIANLLGKNYDAVKNADSVSRIK